jgi:hypothetical protein
MSIEQQKQSPMKFGSESRLKSTPVIEQSNRTRQSRLDVEIETEWNDSEYLKSPE